MGFYHGLYGFLEFVYKQLYLILRKVYLMSQTGTYGEVLFPRTSLGRGSNSHP